MNSNQDRKYELEQKKAILEEFKRRKRERQQQQNGASGVATTAVSKKVDLNDIEKIICEIEADKKQAAAAGLTLERTFMKQSAPRQQNLTIVRPNSIEIPSKELITYCKETQTATAALPDTPPKRLPLEVYDGPFIYDTLQWEDEFHSNSSVDLNHSSNLLNHYSTVNDITTDDEELVTCLDTLSNSLREHHELKEFKIESNCDKQRKMYERKEFYSFIKTKTSIVEKALNQEDIFYDYGTDLEKTTNGNDNGEALKVSREFCDDKSRNRVVTCLDWSSYYPELLLASYENGMHDDGDGVAVLWNMKFEKSTPEYTFNCTSWVTSCCFTDFHPNLIIAGTYSGQIVMWDTRSSKRTPIQRSSLAISSHTNPIYCCKVIGAQNAHNLLSISNDGRLCTWTLDNMNVPVTTLDLSVKQTSSIPVTCMDFKANDLNNFVVGTEDAYSYTVSRHGSKTGLNESFEGHYGPITAISCNSIQDPVDFSSLFLTSSFDWSVKLWNMTEPTTPIYSFEDNNDYVYDVSWSPIHPALFASCDGAGRLDLWNLNQDSEIPSASLRLNDGLGALNKLKWTKCGSKIALGDDLGKVTIVEVSESMAKPKSDESKKLVNGLTELKQNYADLQEIHSMNKSMSELLAAI